MTIEHSRYSGMVEYGAQMFHVVFDPPQYEPDPNNMYKKVSANNRGSWNWVGVSEEEFELSKKGFENVAE